MLNIQMKSTPPLTKETIISINNIKIQTPLSAKEIEVLNQTDKTNSNRTSESSYTSAHNQTSGMNASTDTTNTDNHNQTKSIVSQSIPPLLHTVQKGQKMQLFANSSATKIKACLGWNVTNAECDVDVSAFMLDSTVKVPGDNWFVFYGQPESPDSSIIFKSDEIIDRESISIDFTKLNPAVSKIVFVLTINEAYEKKLNFSMIKDAYIRILNFANNSELVSFKMDEYYSNVTSMMIGELYIHNGNWKFNAIGNGVAKDLAGLCELYGVQVI